MCEGASPWASRSFAPTSSSRPDTILAQVADRPETAAGANYFLARIARQSNDVPEARRRIDRSIAADGTYADAWAELGLLQTRVGEYKAAEEVASEGVDRCSQRITKRRSI